MARCSSRRWRRMLEIGASPLFVHYQLPPAELRRTALRIGVSCVVTEIALGRRAGDDRYAATVHDAPWMRWSLCDRSSCRRGLLRRLSGARGRASASDFRQHGLAEDRAAAGARAVAEAATTSTPPASTHRDTSLVVTPMSHAYAYGMGMMVPLVSGASVMSLRRFALKKVLDVLSHAEVSVFPAVPAMLDMLLFGKGGELLARPRIVLSAGAPLTRGARAKIFSRSPAGESAPLYGTTETGGITVGAAGISAEKSRGSARRLAGVSSAQPGTGRNRLGSRTSAAWRSVRPR